MSGFGAKKKEHKGSSKKLQKLSEKDLKAKSINNHIKGNLDEAEKGYITFLRNGYSDADIISNYALICCLLYTSPSPRDRQKSRMPSSA